MRWTSTATDNDLDPLRILFCGADEFSIYSLRALRDSQEKRPDKIDSIDVVCRPDKRVGRGYKQIQQVPIKRVATELGLKLHQIDTFKDWTPPGPVDLIVAVSFGLLVPARIINGAKYGGLNVHPSLLPEFRGAAPVQHTLLKRRTRTGVSLQTMHPTRFDHGVVLDQTGVEVPPDSLPQDLVEVLGPLGAKMLAKGVENGVFVPPLRDICQEASEIEPSHAPKITPEDRRIDWSTCTASEIMLRDRVLGRLWDNETYGRCMYAGSDEGLRKRVMFQGPWETIASLDDHYQPTEGSTQSFVLIEKGRNTKLGIRTRDNCIVVPAQVTVEGEPRGGGVQKLVEGLKRKAKTMIAE